MRRAVTRPAAETGRMGRMLGTPAFSVVLGLLALLLFCWPFVRDPPLSLVLTSIHLLGAWLLVVAMLWLVSRRLVAEQGEDVARDEDG